MIEKLKSKVSLTIEGRNINRFINKLTKRKIEILSLKYKNRNTVNILIYKKDLETVYKLKSIYQITENSVYGILKIKENIKLNTHLIIIILITLSLFFVLINTVFDIEIIHSSKDVRTLLKNELEENGIRKFTFRKTYNELEKIKEKIIDKYPDKIEWLEIERKGTKYTVKVEERKINKKDESNTPRNIIAKKSGIIKKVLAEKGDIVKDKDDYVQKGDLVVNGEIIFNEETKGKVKAEGKVYAEVWYVTKTEYPFAYFEEKDTGKSQNIYKIKFLNKDFELTFNKYKTKKENEQILLKNNILPIKLIKTKQREIKKINQVLTFEQALTKAENLSIKKIEDKLSKDEYIIRSKYLKSTVKESIVEVEMFFAVYEDITDYKEIEWWKVFRQTLIEILGEVWPTILISSVIAISMRLVYIFKNKKPFILYKELLALAFIVYVLCLFYVVTFQDVSWSTSNYIPFKEMFRYSFGSRLFIKNVIGNIILFIPYGFFIGYYLKLNRFSSAAIMITITSLSIEITQLLIGRVFDIDDIILNIIGGIFGFYIFKSLDIIKSHLPKILKRPAFYNIIVILLIILSILYMFNLIELGV